MSRAWIWVALAGAAAAEVWLYVSLRRALRRRIDPGPLPPDVARSNGHRRVSRIERTNREG